MSGRAGDYLDVRYANSRVPRGAYPERLARWLLDNAYGRTGRLLDLGCGRGDFLDAFAGLGFEAVGVDASPRAAELAPHLEVAVADFARAPLPFGDGEFDFVFSKSVVEHLRDPIAALTEACRVLRPGGRIVVMTPSWQHMHWGPFYADPTHVSPFTAPSLRDALALAGFEEASARHFRQLPPLWRRPALTPLAQILAALPLPYRPYREAPWPERVNKAIRFAKEVMLLGIATRPRA